MDSLRPFLNLAPRRKASIGLTLLLLTGLVLSACGGSKKPAPVEATPIVLPASPQYNILCMGNPIAAGATEASIREEHNIGDGENAATIHPRPSNAITEGPDADFDAVTIHVEKNLPGCLNGTKISPADFDEIIIATLGQSGMPAIGEPINDGIVAGMVKELEEFLNQPN